MQNLLTITPIVGRDTKKTATPGHERTSKELAWMDPYAVTRVIDLEGRSVGPNESKKRFPVNRQII
jgi:hypothetical protein